MNRTKDRFPSSLFLFVPVSADQSEDDRSFYNSKIHTEDRDCIRCFARGNIKQRHLYLMSYTCRSEAE